MLMTLAILRSRPYSTVKIAAEMPTGRATSDASPIRTSVPSNGGFTPPSAHVTPETGVQGWGGTWVKNVPEKAGPPRTTAS